MYWSKLGRQSWVGEVLSFLHLIAPSYMRKQRTRRRKKRKMRKEKGRERTRNNKERERMIKDEKE